MVAWKAGAWLTGWKASAVPLTKLQSHVLGVLAAECSPDSDIAGGVAINREGPRFSGDIDIFQDTELRLETAAQADAKSLTDAGLKLSWKKIMTGKREAEPEGLGDRMRLEWVHDSAFRFFPPQRDELFGYVLHPADLATNKASAAADRRESRDIVDLVTIHERIVPLGAVVLRRCRTLPRPVPGRDACRYHAAFINRVPSDAVGVLFLEGGRAVQPDLEALGKYQRHAGAPGGVWPSSPDISSAMLESYNKKPNGNETKP
jgi:hypothetical protein